MEEKMKLPYRLFQKKNGYYFCEHRETGAQHSLRTKDKAEANRLLNARNEGAGQPGFALHIAKAYLAAADPTVLKRTWSYVADQLIQTKHGENAVRWQRAIKDKALARILDLRLIETRPEHFLAALKAGTVSTNVFLRRLHNFAIGLGWLLSPVLPPKQWPAVRHGAKRAISLAEHQRILAREGNAERRAYYQLLWELGGAQGDIARLCAGDIDWRTKSISYFRSKTGRASRICFDEAVEKILRSLPSEGPLFPYPRLDCCQLLERKPD